MLVLQVAYSSKVLSESEILDLAQNFIRPHLVSVRGAAVSLPFGGKGREIAFDLDSQAMQAHGLSPADIQTARDQPCPGANPPASPRSVVSSMP